MYLSWPNHTELTELALLEHHQLKQDAAAFPQIGISSYEVPTYWGEFVLCTSAFGAAFLFMPGMENTDIAQRLDYYGIALSSTGRKMAIEVGLELMGYTLKEFSTFETPIDISYLSPFQQDILFTCRTIPFGETRTYGELAAMAGHPRKGGAAATVLKHNPLPILIPCHRVLPVDQSLGTYCWHPTWKQHLLHHEGIEKQLVLA